MFSKSRRHYVIFAEPHRTVITFPFLIHFFLRGDSIRYSVWWLLIPTFSVVSGHQDEIYLFLYIWHAFFSCFRATTAGECKFNLHSYTVALHIWITYLHLSFQMLLIMMDVPLEEQVRPSCVCTWDMCCWLLWSFSVYFPLEQLVRACALCINAR